MSLPVDNSTIMHHTIITIPTHHSLNHNVCHLIEEADVVARPEAMPQGQEQHGDGKGEILVTKPLQTRVHIPEQGKQQWTRQIELST